ncbi:MAG: substrate-binding domain-containing protein [Eubacteriales bacterium]
MKKILVVLIVVIFTLAVVGCTAQGPTANASASATSAPSVAASSAAPASSAAAASSAAPASKAAASKPVINIAAGPAAGKTDADYQFGFSFGGINPYADPVEPAAKVAEQELGLTKHLMISTPQDWQQNEQNQMLDSLIAAGCKGILMMPSEATASNEQITKMVKAGIPVVCMGGPPALPSDATLTLATNVYNSAFAGTEAVIKAMGEKGVIVGLSGATNDTNTKQRFQAIKDAVAKYPNVKLLQTIGDIDNADGSMTAVANVLAASGDQITGMISTAYYPSVAMAKYLAKPEYAHIKGVAIDTDQSVLDAIKAGTLYGTMSQNPWGQSYIGIYTLKMLVDGYKYKTGQDAVIDSGSFLVTKDNIASYDDLKMQVTNKLISNWLDRFDAPAK